MVASAVRSRYLLRRSGIPSNGILLVILVLGFVSREIGGFFQPTSMIVSRHMMSAAGGARGNVSFRAGLSTTPLNFSERKGRIPKTVRMSAGTAEESSAADLPQVWASSVSTKKELVPAINEAAERALAQLPEGATIDLALIHVSSIYGNTERLEFVVPELRKAVPSLGAVVGCSSAGVVAMRGKGRAVEVENRVSLGLTLATLPGVKVQPFYLNDMDVPDPLDPPGEWKRAVRMRDYEGPADGAGCAEGTGEPIFLLYATPQSIDSLQDYIAGMDVAFPRSGKIGAIASTVSSLTKSCVFFGEKGTSGTIMEESSYYREGMVGVSLAGDIRMRSFISQGARRVGPTFHVDKVDGPVVQTLRLAERGADDKGEDDRISPAIPPLAMIKQVENEITDQDRYLMRNDLLVGIAPELVMDTPSELRAVNKGAGARFVVQGIVRKKPSDGSITVASEVTQGARLQFFVRDRKAAVKEFNSALVAYKRRQLMETLNASSSIEADSGDADGAAQSPDEADSKDEPQVGEADGVVDSLGSQGAEEGSSAGGGFRAAGALVFPGLDRGRTLWEEDGYQSSLLLKTVPVPLGGFFVNGVAGSITEGSRTSLFGSSTAVAVFSPITARRTTVFADDDREEGEGDETSDAGNAPGVYGDGDEVFSDDSDDFTVIRRDINSGRPVVSGPVLYSVAETVAQPRNSLEAIVWEKEAEVDRYRDRWPMSMLVSRVRAFGLIEENKPRDVLAALLGGKRGGGVAMLAEIKRTAPLMGPINRDIPFNAIAISRAVELGGAAAIAVNTDRKFFGCSYEDLTNVRSAVSVPVMCSDVMVYPYQIYQARLAGADAIKLFAPALPDKDLVYFHKIAAAIGMQSVVAVSSVKQMLMALSIPDVKMVSINNRNTATWVLDETRVGKIMGDAEVQQKLKEKDVTLLVEAGLKTKEDIDAVKAAGISVVSVGEAFLKTAEPGKVVEALLS